jgi:hypothetical protein
MPRRTIKPASSKPAAGSRARSSDRIEAVIRGAGEAGLLSEKSGRIAGRISSDLIAQAKRRTGIRSDTELLRFVLASVALEDHFGETFSNLRGTVDRNIDLEF